MVNQPGDYLLPEARKLLDSDINARVRYIEKDTWIGYPCAKKALMKLNDLYHHSERLRMPNLLIIGPTNNGKSMITEKYYREHPPLRGINEMGIQNVLLELPVLMVQMPTNPDIKRFFISVLGKLEQRERIGSYTVSYIERYLYDGFKERNVKMIIIDEIHNILAGSIRQQWEFLNLLRFMGNELRIPIVCVGTKDAYLAIRNDPQLENRFEPFIIPVWQANDEYEALLASFIAILPLKKRSNLNAPNIAEYILRKSEGIIGEISTLIRKAGVYAIRSGLEEINKSVLDSIEYHSPGERRQIFEKELQ